MLQEMVECQEDPAKGVAQAWRVQALQLQEQLLPRPAPAWMPSPPTCKTPHNEAFMTL